MTRSLISIARPCLRRWSLLCTTYHTFWGSHLQNMPKRCTAHAHTACDLASIAPVNYIPPSQPPSARPVQTRKSQLLRSYTSLLRSTPLMLFFQHSNLTAVEWSAVRRELNKAVATVPNPGPIEGRQPLNASAMVQLQVLKTTIFSVALKIVEFYNPQIAGTRASTPRAVHGPLVHDLSQSAYDVVRETSAPLDSAYGQVKPLMVGPLATLVFPAISPAHLAAALSILAPVPGRFPAPLRKKSPGYYDASCQSGLTKLILMGGRVEGKIFDNSGINWIGSIEGGLYGLRGQLMNILHGAGLSLTTTLDSGSRNIWLALEGRKGQLEGSEAKELA